jgi:hypothetical protein
MRARLGAWFSGAGWFAGAAIGLFLFALLATLVEVQSPDVVLWTGQHVVGTEQGGVVIYEWHGQSYAVDAPGSGSSNAVSVYLDPADPNHAMIDSAAGRALSASLVGVPLAGGVVLLTVGLTRRYRWGRRQRRRAVSGPGQGLDQEFVARHLRELRGDDGTGQ